MITVESRVADRFGAVLLVVHGSRDDLAWIRHRAQQRDRFHWYRPRLRHQCARTIHDPVEVLNEHVVPGKRVALAGQYVERASHVPNRWAIDYAKAIVIEATETHDSLSAR
jgi:hypothetical protein